MAKYELLKKENNDFGADVVAKEYLTTDSWKEILASIKNYMGTTNILGLHVRFNVQPYEDLSYGVISDAGEESGQNLPTLKALENHLETQKGYGRDYFKKA